MLIGYPFAGMWRSAAQQLASQKLEAVCRGRGSSNFPLLWQVVTYQSTANHAAAGLYSSEETSKLDCDSAFQPGLRFLKSSSPSVSSLDSAFVELVDLLPQCVRRTSATDFNRDYSKPLTPLQVSESFAYARALGDDELSQKKISSKVEDEDDMGNSLVDSHEDSVLVTEVLLEQKTKKKTLRELYKRQVEIETEAWQKAATEYKDLMTEMCRKSLAPNLPFAQSLLLSWFEPLRFVSSNSIILACNFY